MVDKADKACGLVRLVSQGDQIYSEDFHMNLSTITAVLQLKETVIYYVQTVKLIFLIAGIVEKSTN